MNQGSYPILFGPAAHVYIYVHTALCIGIILNCNFAATSNGEIILTSNSNNNTEAVENFRKFGININTLEHFPIEENGAFKIVNVIESLNAINKIGVLKILGYQLLGGDYDINNLFDSMEREIIVLELFQRWLYRKGTQEKVTCKSLAEALSHRKIAMKDLSEKIVATCEMYQVLDSPCKPRSFLVYSLKVADEYKKSYVIENEKLWLPTRLPTQKIQFVPLEFRDMQTDSNILVSDIIASNFTDHSRFLFTGRPGSGKSTLARYLAKELVDKKMFDTVIQVDLGTNQKIDSLLTLLQVATANELPLTLTVINATARFVRAIYGDNICFLLDGYNDYLPADSSDFIHRLISKRVLSKSTVVLTSRPMAVEDIKSNFYRIEVLGFGDEGIRLYLQHFNASAVKFVYKYFDLYPNIHQLCHLPLHLSMLVSIATYAVDTGTPATVNTETMLYSKFFSLTVKNYEKAKNKTVNILFECYKNPNKHSNFCTLLHKISKISFEGVLQQRLYFTISDFDGLLESSYVSKELKLLGLFKVEKKNDDYGAEIETYFYAHPTFQEFLGAFHLALLLQYSQTDFFNLYWKREMEMYNYAETIFFDLYWKREMEMYKFAFGLMRTVLNYDSNAVLKSYVRYGRKILANVPAQVFHVVKCAHEIGDGNLFIQSLREVNVIDKTNSVRLITSGSLDCWYIGYLLTQSPIWELKLDIVYDVNLCFLYLIKYLRVNSASNKSVRVKQLWLRSDNTYYSPSVLKFESEIHINQLVAILSFMSNDLTYLALREVTFEYEESIMHIGNILKSCKQIKSVDLSLNASIIQKGYLEKALKNISQLEHLQLGLAYTYNGVAIIPDDTFEHLRLKNINHLGIHAMWSKNLVDVNLTAFIGGLRHMTGLKKLSIRLRLHDGFRTNGAEELGKGIKMLPGVTDLELDLNMCGPYTQFDKVVTIQEIHTLLKELSPLLKNFTFCIKYYSIAWSIGVVELAEGLKTLSHLHTLSLKLWWDFEDDSDVDKSTVALYNSLKHLHNLDSIYLDLQFIGRLTKLAITFQSLAQLKEISIYYARRKCLYNVYGKTQFGNRIGETDIPQLLADLRITALTRLDLSWNFLTDQEIPSLLEALRNMPDLKTLDLSNNQIGDNEISNLADTIVTRLPNLEVLLLNNNNITEVGAKILSWKLKHCTKLYKLALDLEIVKYSVHALLPKQSVSFNNTNKVEIKHCFVDWHGKISVCLLVVMAISLTSIMYIVLKLKLNRNRKHKKNSLASALALATTSSSWRLDKLDKYDLDGTGTVVAILDTAIHPNCPIRDFDQIDVREDLPSLSSVFQNLSSDLLPSEQSVFHGSICALVAAGSPDMDPQIPRGVVPEAKILIYRITNGEKNDDAQSINKAVLKALMDLKKMLSKALKMDVVLISYDLENSEHMKDIKQNITELTEMGVSFVVSAGNDRLLGSKATIFAHFNKIVRVWSLNKYKYRSEFDPDIPEILNSDLTCSSIMKLFHGKVPFSRAADLGVHLEIEYAIVEDVTYKKNPQEMMSAILNYWLEYGKERSWSKLAEAVEYCGYKVVAEKIRSDHAHE